MFVSHAKVRIVGLGGRSRKRRPHRRRLGLREMAKMPCLVPTALTVLLGLFAVAFGAGMALLGYLPTMDTVVEVAPVHSRDDIEHSESTQSIIVYNSSAALPPTPTSPRIFSFPSGTAVDSVSSNLHTNGPSYLQPSEPDRPTNFSHDQQKQQGVRGHKNLNQFRLDISTTKQSVLSTTTATIHQEGAATQRQINTKRFLALRACSYAGPVVMAIGMFAMIMACVFYCEILDKYAILVPDKSHGSGLQKDELYEIIIGEMKKSYAQTLITAYTKAAERSLLIHENVPAGTGAAAPAVVVGSDGEDTQQQQQQQQQLSDPLLPYNPLEPLSLEQQIDIECEGYTPSPPVPNKRYSVIQARIQRLRSEDNWLKTSSLPNIRRSMSIKRAGRVGTKIADNSRTLSYDYTMDEARLRRKSMMLRSIVQWNSGSSGDLIAQQAQAARAMHQRRFSSAKALQNQPDDSLDELFQEQSHGSFPLTRLIQRRGTFACGDMRTRRMKFLLLLQASESNEVFQQQQQQHRRQSTYPTGKHHQHDNVSMDSRSASRFAGIRRNSFIPYNTCDKFITTEEKRTARSSRRSSVNPFAPRLAQQYSQPERGTIRRHSFFPIRREDKIYESDPLEQRRHSFNPIGVNNTLKSEYAGGAGIQDRRGSYNPDSRRGSFNPDSRRGSFAPPSATSGQQKSPRFLQVPGFEHEFHMERGPSGDSTSSEASGSPYLLSSPPSRQSDIWPYCGTSRSPGKPLLPTMSSHMLEAQPIERRHSFNPVVRISDTDTDAPNNGAPDVPIIVLNADTSGRFLTVPSQDIELGMTRGTDNFEMRPEQRRHSFNTTTQSLPSSKFGIEKPVPQRNISFKFDSSLTSISSQASPPSSTSSSLPHQVIKRSSLKRASMHKPTETSSSPDSSAGVAVRPSSFKQEMVLFQPLSKADSRGASPSSNLSFCGSERVGSERSPKASRTASISSDYSAVTTSALPDVPYRESSVSYGTFRPVSPAGQLTCRQFLPISPLCMDRDAGHYVTTDGSSYYNDRQFVSHPTHQTAGEIRRSASFRESRRRPIHHVRTDSSGSTGSGPATLSPSLNTDANAAIHRSRSAGSLPGERATIRREVDLRALRVLSPRWDDIRMSPQEAKRLAEESFASRASSPQSPHRAFSYASSRVPKPPSPLVGKHWPPSRHDADSNSS
ncbi:hypothetical protein ElyMa_002608300 [Elysia marginata]|uniref:Uncharacterized protein n=1 Tax=Elysia marginata TaxID=1093978 RepID=A0AAV4H1Y1_9GAST|nr:hypothetical protein ElyMa_002608300 [Elysia marginata]